MNWYRENPFISGLIMLTVLVCCVLGYFLSKAMGEYSEVKGNYNAKVMELKNLQNHDPYPNQENLDKVNALRDDYKKELNTYKQVLSAFIVPIDQNVTPQDFQDMLSEESKKIAAKAAAVKVTLPTGFSFGFDYLTSPPTRDAAPALARQLKIISKVVSDLVGDTPEASKVISLDSIDRPKLAEEGGVVARPTPAPVQRNTGRRGGGAAAPAATAEVAEDSDAFKFQPIPFTISFTTEQEKFRVAFNNIVRSNPFLIVRTLNIRNSNPSAPTKEDTNPSNFYGDVVVAAPATEAPAATETSSTGAPATEGTEAAATSVAPSTVEAPAASAPAAEVRAPKSEEELQALRFIFGREKVEVRMLIDFIDFQFPQVGEGTK